MKTPISFFVQGDPKGQPRPRAFARKMGDKFVARVFDDGSAEGWKSCIAVAAKPFIGDPFTGPIKLTLGFRLRRPKSHYRTGKNANLLREDAPTYHTAKPDADNFAKAVMDALTSLRMWNDDSQVAVLKVWKLWEAGLPGCYITIEEATAK